MSDDASQEGAGGYIARLRSRLRANRLLREYAPLTKERLDLGRHAGALPRAGEPVYRWVRYKEAYSPQLVRDMLDELP